VQRLAEPADRVRGRVEALHQRAAAAGTFGRALALLEEASAAAGEGELRSRAERLRGLTLFWAGRGLEATGLLEREAERAALSAPLLAAAMLADGAMAATAQRDCRRSLALAERGVRLLGDGGDPPARAHALAVLSWALVLRGQVPRARRILDEVGPLAATIDPLSPPA
jgi:hypothetical protein